MTIPTPAPAPMTAEINTSAEACAVACMLVSNPMGALRKDGDGWQRRVNDLIRALSAERDALTARVAELERVNAEHAGMVVTWERLRDAHSGMRGVKPWEGSGPNEGHRSYRQNEHEACYMCAALRRIKVLESELAAARKVDDGEVELLLAPLRERASPESSVTQLEREFAANLIDLLTRLSAALKEWQTLAHGAALECEQQKARAQAAEAKLETARRDALEEAALADRALDAACRLAAAGGGLDDRDRTFPLKEIRRRLSGFIPSCNEVFAWTYPIRRARAAAKDPNHIDNIRALQTKDTTQ